MDGYSFTFLFILFRFTADLRVFSSISRQGSFKSSNNYNIIGLICIISGSLHSGGGEGGDISL